jgi:hypothetical protein
MLASLRAGIELLGRDRRGFIRATGVDKGALSAWLAGRVRPSLEAILRICSTGGWSVRAFLNGSVLEDSAAAGPGFSTHGAAESRRIDWRRLRRQFRRLLDQPGEPATLTQIARQLGIDPSHLCRQAPELTAEAVEAVRAWRSARATERRDRAVSQVVPIQPSCTTLDCCHRGARWRRGWRSHSRSGSPSCRRHGETPCGD